MAKKKGYRLFTDKTGEGNYKSDPRTGLPIVGPSGHVRAKFDEETTSDLHHAIVHFFDTVIKCNKRFKKQERVLILTHNLVFSCKPDGAVNRVVPVDELEKLYIDEKHCYLGLNTANSYDLLWQLSPGSFKQLLSTLQKLYEYRLDTPLPLQHINIEDKKERNAALKTMKPEGWDKRWKQLQQTPTPITSVEDIDRYYIGEKAIDRKHVLLSGIVESIASVQGEVDAETQRLKDSRREAQRKELELAEKVDRQNRELDAVEGRINEAESAKKELEGEKATLEEECTEYDTLTAQYSDLLTLEQESRQAQTEVERQQLLHDLAKNDLQKAKEENAEVQGSLAPYLEDVLQATHDEYRKIGEEMEWVRRIAEKQTCKKADIEGREQALREARIAMLKEQEETLGQLAYWEDRRAVYLPNLETKALSLQDELDCLEKEVEYLDVAKEKEMEQLVVSLQADQVAYEDEIWEIEELVNARENYLDEVAQLVDFQLNTNSQFEEEYIKMQTQLASNVCAACGWRIQYPEQQRPRPTKAQVQELALKFADTADPAELPSNFSRVVNLTYKFGTTKITLMPYEDRPAVTLGEGYVTFEDYIKIFGNLECRKLATELRAEMRASNLYKQRLALAYEPSVQVSSRFFAPGGSVHMHVAEETSADDTHSSSSIATSTTSKISSVPNGQDTSSLNTTQNQLETEFNVLNTSLSRTVDSDWNGGRPSLT